MGSNSNISSNIFEALHQIAAEKGISREKIEEIIETAIIYAYKKQYGTTNNIRVVFNRDDNTVKIISFKMVVKRPTNLGEEISFDQAVKQNPGCKPGDNIEVEEDPFKIFGRIATQTAKQVILQKIKETEKNLVFDEFKTKEGELINGYMQRRQNNTIYVDIGNSGVEGLFPRSEQSPIEHYKTGDRIKALIYKVEKTSKGPRITLSRAHPKFIEKLFEMEIPEIYDGIVQIRKVERIPGVRTKIAVHSMDRDIDPVGACVGMKGSRIQSIVRELEGEKIDIIEFSSDKRAMAENALTPAKVNEVVLTRDGGIIAVVDNDQFKLALGKDGHNLRLASRLCGFDIMLKTEEEYKELLSQEGGSQLVANQLFSTIDENETALSELGLESRLIELLEKGGIFSVEDLVEKGYEGVLDIEGIGEKSAEKIFKTVEELVDFSEEDGDDKEEEDEVEEEKEKGEEETK